MAISETFSAKSGDFIITFFSFFSSKILCMSHIGFYFFCQQVENFATKKKMKKKPSNDL